MGRRLLQILLKALRQPPILEYVFLQKLLRSLAQSWQNKTDWLLLSLLLLVVVVVVVVLYYYYYYYYYYYHYY